MLTRLWNLKYIENSRQSRSKNKLVRENAVTRAHGRCSLRVMGSCRHHHHHHHHHQHHFFSLEIKRKSSNFYLLNNFLKLLFPLLKLSDQSFKLHETIIYNINIININKYNIITQPFMTWHYSITPSRVEKLYCL